jgi:hypothetical protein
MIITGDEVAASSSRCSTPCLMNYPAEEEIWKKIEKEQTTVTNLKVAVEKVLRIAVEMI